MKIGIIAAGNVGGTLGRRWAEGGHDVVFGVRDPSSDKAEDLVKATSGKVRAGALAEAAAHGDVLALTTPWTATEKVLKGLGDLGGKVLLDCTNPLNPDLSLATRDTSGAEQVASWAPGARVVKIFNTTGSNNMEDPNYGGLPATMFLAGDDREAKPSPPVLPMRSDSRPSMPGH